ncbi:MAG: hypothetical protein AAB250_07885 [Bdellovibrionota bacterium]
MSPNRDIKGYDNTEGQTGLSLAEVSSQNIPVPLHPDRVFGAPMALPPDPIQAVEAFAARLVATLDSDYGDWMREANLALIDLSERLANRPSPKIVRRLAQLQDMIQINPSWHPIETCRTAFRVACIIHHELGGSGKLDLHRCGLGWTEPETILAELEIESPYPHHKIPEHLIVN